eukprot:387387-Prorocentrum_lima.AAC.1
MTSSLVGSEMCIRDSYTRTRWGKPLRPVVAVCNRTSQGRTQAVKIRAVSYTHLTLPTICSV